MKPPPPGSSEADKERDALLKHFRAYLHLAITARQTGQEKELEALPGPNLLTYCRALANEPGISLAGELSMPVVAILKQIEKVSVFCEGVLRHKEEKFVAMHANVKRILEEIDVALTMISRNFLHRLQSRGAVTQYTDLLCEVIHGMVIAYGMKPAELLRRYQKLTPQDGLDEDGSLTEGSFIESFARDVYQRVKALDKLADEFPDEMRFAARRMHAWPMLMHRHTSNRRRFEQLADRLELGADYPVDAGNGARFRPDTPMIRYLDPLIYRLHVMCWELGDMQFDSIKTEQSMLLQVWLDWPDEPPGEEVLSPLRAARQLPRLTKAKASQWAEKVLVPLILATDARDWQHCTEPVLQKIAGQIGVKSRATFKSRLQSAVSATLRRLARPA